jgi:tetratricopeptide (TPR) repeat protein
LKWLRKPLLAAAGVALVLAGWQARAELSRWAELVDSARLDAVFFRSMAVGGGVASARRPPRETRPALSNLITAAPGDAELYSLRALEAEAQMDYAAAEADWKKFEELAADKTAARLALADFYHRRLEPQQELEALSLAARESTPAAERFLPPQEQRPWRTYERILALVDAQAMPPEAALPHWRSWIAQYPREVSLYERFFRFALDRKRYDLALEAIEARERAFPEDGNAALAARAELERARGSNNAARQLYEKAWNADWEDAIVGRYFALLKQTGSLRRFLEQARAALAADPLSTRGPVMLAQYHRQQGNPAAALQALQEFEDRRGRAGRAWTAAELRTLADQYQRLNHYDGAARAYHSLHQLGSEEGLAGLAEMLLRVPEQRIGLRAGDLSLYRDIARVDTGPGYLNGILSLLLNSQSPEIEFSNQSQESLRYFQRAQAGRLVGLFEQRFPQSPRRASLRAQLIEAYGIHGDDEAVIAAGTSFLSNFPRAAGRERVALVVASSFARQGRPQQEFALYDSLLDELAKAAENVPLGASGVTVAPAPEPPSGEEQPEDTGTPRSAVAQARLPRSPAYARILDRYLARLVSLKRTQEALGLYRREIDRNPNDPGLYERLASFLEQNKLTAELEKTYRDAIAKFPGSSWEHKLARWYLRRKQTQQLDALTREVAKTFSGTGLETYLREVVPQGAVAPSLAVQFNRYALARFPHNLTFVRNLLALYSTRPTANAVEYEALLRKHWFHAEDLRVRFFELLSRNGRLDAELAAVRAANPNADAGKWTEAAEANPAAIRFLAEAEAWRGHFEPAAPALLEVSAVYPADQDLGRRAASVHRSLSAFQPAMEQTAVTVEERLARAHPRDISQLIRAGELHADRERLEQAAAWWNRAAAVEPGRADGYLEAATVFWDYYRYDDALRLIEAGRSRTGNAAAYTYEAGAIQESKRDFAAALREYARGSLAGVENALRRFLSLAKRPQLRQAADQLTANLISGRDPSRAAIRLRAEMLRSQNRRSDLEAMLLQLAGGAASPDTLADVENWARIEGLDRAERAAIERQIALATDPVEKMRLRIRQARWLEARGETAAGARAVDALLADNPLILGVVRAAADYHWRTKNVGRAVAVLEESARKASPGLRESFLLEAAQKASQAGEVATARRLLDELLRNQPFAPRYVAAYAGTFARQNDNRGLRDFYIQKLQALRGSALAPAERAERIAALRRSLIPVLSRLGDHAAAADQYIEILNRYPEDASLAQEAAAYAAAHGQKRRLIDAYTKAMAEAPRDFRWALVNARIQTQFEDLPAAVAAYERALEIRPDRVDFLLSAASLEERLLRFEEAEKRYRRAYELSYRNPDHLEKVAEMQARLGRPAGEVETTLRRALVEGRPPRASTEMRVAERLESWGMTQAAAAAAEAAIGKAAPDEMQALLPSYARILTRARKHTQALAVIGKTDSYEGGLRSVGAAVSRYFTPEEKARLAGQLASLAPARRILLAQAAGMTELEARTRYEFAIANAGRPEGRVQLDALAQLQRRRGMFQELGTQLEAYARALPADSDSRDTVLSDAAEAFHAAGAVNNELRVLSLLARSGLEEPRLSRYTKLVLRQPQRFRAEVTAGPQPGIELALLNRAVQEGSTALALEGIAARGARMTPAWTRAYTGLVGLYLNSVAPEVRQSFAALLGSPLIGDRIGKSFEPNQTIAGEWWFYYANRFGEYLDLQNADGAQDYLPAGVEGRPASVDAYFQLAEYQRGRRRYAAAREHLEAVLALEPSFIAAHDRLGAIAAAEGRNPQAVEEWRTALRKLGEMQDGSRVPPSFWMDFASVMKNAGAAGQGAALRAEVNRLLEIYVRRNGLYNFELLAEGILAMAGPDEGARWIATLGASAQDPVQFLASVVAESWIPEARRGAIHAQLVETARAKAAQSFGQQAEFARAELARRQLDYARFLLDRGQAQQARQELESIAEESRAELFGYPELEIRAAAQTNSLDALLARYEADRDNRPDADLLQRAISELRKLGATAAARRVAEFLYSTKLAAGDLNPSTFLGAAEAKLEAGDTPAAVAILRRMTLVTEQPFESLSAAVSLLEKYGRRPESLEFADAWAKAEPWNVEARWRVAALRNAVADLIAIASSSDAPYSARIAAARALANPGTAITSGSTELDLLASGRALTEAEASQSYFLEARLAAADRTADRAVRLRLLASALAVEPLNDVVRLRLFETAAEGRQDYRTSNTFLSTLGPMWFDGGEEFRPESAEEFLAQQPYSMEQRARIAARLGDAQQRLGNLRSAELFYRVAAALHKNEAAAREATKNAETVARLVAMETRNEASRPVIAEGLEQDRVVRPREVAR